MQHRWFPKSWTVMISMTEVRMAEFSYPNESGMAVRWGKANINSWSAVLSLTRWSWVPPSAKELPLHWSSRKISLSSATGSRDAKPRFSLFFSFRWGRRGAIQCCTLLPALFIFRFRSFIMLASTDTMPFWHPRFCALPFAKKEPIYSTVCNETSLERKGTKKNKGERER